MKLQYFYQPGVAKAAFRDNYGMMARAATEAMKEVAADAKQRGRQSIAAASGRFGKSWQNALRDRVFPTPPKYSVGPTGYIWLKSTYAGIFEYGGTVTGKPILWLPLKSSPTTLGRKKLTPELFRQQVGPLYSVNRVGKPPLLVAKMATGRARGDKTDRNVTLAKLRRGASATSKYVMVPIFFGTPNIKINPKFKIRQAAKQAAAKLPNLYYQKLRA